MLELDENALNSCIQEIESRIIPRLNTLWGRLPDIDNDGKISLLFTPTINEEKTAIGFFNPEDFYKRDDFSPFSNEMDILYIAIPEMENFSYSAKCISATIAHELTHAINYNIKTYSRILNNEINPPEEEGLKWAAKIAPLTLIAVCAANCPIHRHFLLRYKMAFSTISETEVSSTVAK